MEIKQVTKPIVNQVAIVGAGPGGLATAIALRNFGIDAHVYERAKDFRPVGAGLGLLPNGLKSLEAIKPGIFETLKGVGNAGTRMSLKKRTGEIIQSTKSKLLEKYGLPSVTIWWWRLQQTLASYLPPEIIHLNHRCIGFEQNDSSVTAHFDGGNTACADLLIGADGVHSAIRKSMIADDQLRYVGSISWRSVVPYHRELLHPDGVVLMKGEGRILYLLNVGEGSMSWLARKLLPNAFRSGNAAEVKARVLDEFSDWMEPVRSLIEATDANQILEAPIYDREPLTSWHQGRVTLLGDAAHPMTPAVGQGTNTTFEDAYELAQCLSQCSDIEEALTTYENRRIPRTQVIQARSALAEQRYYATDTGKTDSDKAQQEQIALEQFRHWLYAYDPNSESRFQPWIETPAR